MSNAMRQHRASTTIGMRATLAAFSSLLGACAEVPRAPASGMFGEAVPFAPGIATTPYSDVRLTISPDGKTALWFSRDRPGGPGGYDIWMARRGPGGWQPAQPVPFNSSMRDFDPAFSADGRFVYFCSDRAGTLGGDDLYRARVFADGFGEPENLGGAVNTARNEWAPMLSPDGRMLLYSSDGFGAAQMDLITSRVIDGKFTAAVPLPGDINTHQNEFDATFLADGRRVIFTRAANLAIDAVRLFHAAPSEGRYDAGTELPPSINTPGGDTYAPMLDWSQRNRLTFTTRRPAKNPHGADLYVVRYR